MKGMDIVGFALIAVSVVLVLSFGVSPSAGFAGGESYSLRDLGPLLPGMAGLLLVVLARFKK